MGQSASSRRRRGTILLSRDFHQLENDVREDSDYVTLVRVNPTTNDLSALNNAIDPNIDRRSLRPVSPLPNLTLNRRKTTFEPNIYSDLKEYLQPKNNNLIANELAIGDGLDDDLPLSLTTAPVGRPLSFANHCSSRCRCPDCRLSRYHLLNWMLPNCTRTNAERLLRGRPDGTFLVRKSEKFPNQYTLSFVCGQVIRHCLILRSVYGFGLKEPYKYPTLQQFVVHYAKHSLSEFNWKLNTTLKYPVFA